MQYNVDGRINYFGDFQPSRQIDKEFKKKMFSLGEFGGGNDLAVPQSGQFKTKTPASHAKQSQDGEAVVSRASKAQSKMGSRNSVHFK